MKVSEMGSSANEFDKDIFDGKTEGNFEGTLETFTVFMSADGMNLSRVPEDYDYDMETSHNTFFWDELLPTLIVYCLTFVLGLVGNFLIIFTIFTYRKMKSTTNVFLASLSSSDLLLILFCIPVKLCAASASECQHRGIMTQRKMERTRTEKERTLRSGLLSTNDVQLSRWHLLRKKLKENIELDGKRPDARRRESFGFPQKIESIRLPGPESLARRIEGDQSRHCKSPRKGSFYLELKTFKKASTARPVEEPRPEMKRFKKQPERVRREEPAAPICLEGGVPDGQKFAAFPNTWEHTNFSVVPSVYYSNRKDFPGPERKRKKSSRSRKRNKSSQRLKTADEKEKKKMQLLLQDKKKDAQIEVLYPQFEPFPKGRRDDDGGQAVVIYQRHNRRDYVYPRTGDGYRFEQIAFSRNCEAAVDIVQSKRSLSEPRQNIPKEFCMAKRRTRLQVEPHRMTSAQSDFHSALDFINQNSACVEFNKFEENNSSFTRFIYQNPLEESKMERDLVCEFDGEDGSVKTNTTKVRLKQTAEKKLDLHREMIRAEKTSKKKFWESIERSLNYRCALAQMLSSQSFISQNNSKFFSTTESSTGRSTNFYVRESVIEKISSYQGFQRFITSNHADLRNKSENITQTSNETYQKMKTFLDSFLIKEEEETLLDAPLEVGFNFASTSGSTIQTAIAPFDFPENLLPCQSASDKLSLLESNLNNGETNSDLEMLMAKLSEEIRRCNRFIGTLKEVDKDDLSINLSVSDSKIELGKSSEGMTTEDVLPILTGLVRDHAVFPVSIHRSKDPLSIRTDTWPEKSKTQIHFQVAQETKKDPQELSIAPRKSDNLQREGSNMSLLSFGLESRAPSKDTQSSKKTLGHLKMPSEDLKKPSRVLKKPSEDLKKPSRDLKKPSRELKLSRDLKPSRDLLCCDDCKRLKEKIKKLEKELAKVEKRMPFYPAEYQDSIKCCLESLKTTSETVLKRLKSCAKLRYLESQQKKRIDGGEQHSRRPLSAPDTAVHKLMSRQLCLRSSNSDYNLNVGMEITMENMDPITGEKLHPEVSENCQQEGNIQCRIFKDKDRDTPLLVMDTDFAYNPKTGMLFKEKELEFGLGQSKDVIVPLDEPVKTPSVFTTLKRSVSAYECIRSEKSIFEKEPSLVETFMTGRDAESSKDNSSVSTEESAPLESPYSDELMGEEVSRSIKMSEKGSRGSSRNNESVKKLLESDEESEKCESDSQKTERTEFESETESESEFEKESKSIIELMIYKNEAMKFRKAEEEGKKVERGEAEQKKKEKDEGELKKWDKDVIEIKKWEKRVAEPKKKVKSKEELKKREKTEEELKKREKSKEELRKREKAEEELRKREKHEEELRKKEKAEEELRKKEKAEEELRKKEKAEEEQRKREKAEEELRKREKEEEELRKREKAEEEVKKREKSKEELKKREKTEECLKKVEKNEKELKRKEKSKSELKKRERGETEPKKRDKNESRLRKREKSEAKLKKREKSEAKLKKEEKSQPELQKSDKTSLQSGDTQASTQSPCTDRKNDRKTVSRIPTRRKTTPSSSRLAGDSSSRKSSASSLANTSDSSEAECYPKISVKLAKLFSFTWTFGFFLCKLVHYMQNVSAICSVLTLTAMSLERYVQVAQYYAIVHPMKAQYICTISQARKIITGTWISAFLLAVPILFAQVHLRVGVKVEAYWCVRDWDNKTIWRAHELYMMLIILVIPTGVMAVAYTAICWEIWEVMQRRHHMTSGKGHAICRDTRLQKTSSCDSFPSSLYNNSATKVDSKRTRGLHRPDPPDDAASVQQVVKMLVAVVVIYVICWGPMLIDNVLQAYGIVSHIRMGWPKYMGTAFHLMAYFNSCINPIIYGFMSKNFRESFRKTLCCVRKRPKSAYRSFSLSQTRTTSVRYAESSFGRTVSIALPV